MGLGLITGAADDDPSAIGTYASAGAALGPGFLWTVPALFPMMFAVVYLASKLGHVTGRGLFAAMRGVLPDWLVITALVGVLAGNTIQAAADLGGMAAALRLLVPIPYMFAVVLLAVVIVTLQILGTYRVIRGVFRWLALVLLTYVGAALLARPDPREVLIGTLVPRVHFDRQFLALLVAVTGTSLSAYLLPWQSTEQVEEDLHRGARSDLRRTRREVVAGMAFSNVIMYFIMLATATTLYPSDIASAADAASALAPVAGPAASFLFALGVVAVGFIAVPVMTAGASYSLAQVRGWRHGLATRFHQARRFYAAILTFTALAVALDAVGVNPMRALVWASIVQGFSLPPLLVVLLLLTNRRDLMGTQTNGRALNILGAVTAGATFAVAISLVASWLV